jgi:secondary thiamine-phosphate synthase enzyme
LAIDDSVIHGLFLSLEFHGKEIGASAHALIGERTTVTGECRISMSGQRAYTGYLASATTTLTIATRGKGLYMFTDGVERWVSRQPIANGVLTLFIQHTSCSLVIQENADPDVTLDMRDFFDRLVPEQGEDYRHTVEGPDDMTSHIRSALTHTSLSIPVISRKLALGTWQGLYVFEHRALPHQRHIVLQLLGE